MYIQYLKKQFFFNLLENYCYERRLYKMIYLYFAYNYLCSKYWFDYVLCPALVCSHILIIFKVSSGISPSDVGNLSQHFGGAMVFLVKLDIFIFDQLLIRGDKFLTSGCDIPEDILDSTVILKILPH